MKRTFFFIAVISFIIQSCHSQNSTLAPYNKEQTLTKAIATKFDTAHLPDELYGFRLGQYKTVVANELGEPNETRAMDDSTAADFYYLSKDSSAYIAFEYAGRKKDEINTIQVSGAKIDRPFYGINIGDDEEKLVATFGKPDTLLAQSFNGRQASIWKYIKLNLSVLFANRKIESIRIWDRYKEVDAESLPTVDSLLKIIQTNDKAKIADILSPTMEVSFCGNIVEWKNSFYKDLYLDTASVMEFITNKQYGLVSLAGKKDIKCEMNVRALEGVGLFPVYKFPKEKLISEIVLNYQQGKYKIWELRYKCDK